MFQRRPQFYQIKDWIKKNEAETQKTEEKSKKLPKKQTEESPKKQPEEIAEKLVDETIIDFKNKTFKLPELFYKTFKGNVLNGQCEEFFKLIKSLSEIPGIEKRRKLLQIEEVYKTFACRAIKRHQILKKAQYHYTNFCANLGGQQNGFEKHMNLGEFISYIEAFINIVTFGFLAKREFHDPKGRSLRERYKNQIKFLNDKLNTDVAFCILKIYKKELTKKIKQSQFFQAKAYKVGRRIVPWLDCLTEYFGLETTKHLIENRDNKIKTCRRVYGVKVRYEFLIKHMLMYINENPIAYSLLRKELCCQPEAKPKDLTNDEASKDPSITRCIPSK
jgi:hypothetical protein